MTPGTYRFKVQRYFQGLSIKTNNFAFEAKANIGQNQTRPGGWMVWWVGGWTE